MISIHSNFHTRARAEVKRFTIRLHLADIEQSKDDMINAITFVLLINFSFFFN